MALKAELSMEELIESGFKARKSGNEKLELHYFSIWREINKIPSDNSFNAELLWEMQLSKLKMKSLMDVQQHFIEHYCN